MAHELRIGPDQDRKKAVEISRFACKTIGIALFVVGTLKLLFPSIIPNHWIQDGSGMTLVLVGACLELVGLTGGKKA